MTYKKNPPPRHKGKYGQKPPVKPEKLWLYGMHTVYCALTNPRRKATRLLATRNAIQRLQDMLGTEIAVPVEMVSPREIDRLLPKDAVHQGLALEAKPLPALSMEEICAANLLIVLDQITDPHNVGAILRTASAFNADALVVTARHSPEETGVMAKSASGALDRIPIVEVKNLGDMLNELGFVGMTRLGFDSEADVDLRDVTCAGPVAIVLGSEGKGLRQRTRSLCDQMVRLDMPGDIKSLNVSNAAAIAMYAVTNAQKTGAE